jgi:hypothetical protein
MVILAGLEWNVPPRGGDVHATVFVDPAAERSLAESKEKFDDLDRPKHTGLLAEQGLRWLAEHCDARGSQAVVVYEHPSRKVDHSLEYVLARDAEGPVDEVEIIVVERTGSRVLALRPPALAEPLTVPQGGVVVRARGRSKVAGGPSLMFYTNPVRVRTSGG